MGKADDPDKRLGVNIQSLRKFYGYSQVEFAELLGNYNRHWLSRIERGQQSLDAKLLPKISILLGRKDSNELVEKDFREKD
jgi:transcriptional regulator with XRE-family HTH domain